MVTGCTCLSSPRYSIRSTHPQGHDTGATLQFASRVVHLLSARKCNVKELWTRGSENYSDCVHTNQRHFVYAYLLTTNQIILFFLLGHGCEDQGAVLALIKFNLNQWRNQHVTGHCCRWLNHVYLSSSVRDLLFPMLLKRQGNGELEFRTYFVFHTFQYPVCLNKEYNFRSALLRNFPFRVRSIC